MKHALRTALAGAVMALLIAAPAPAATPATPVTVDELLSADVIVADGASATDDERGRLEAAARDLAEPDDAGESFPTRFVLIAQPKDASTLDAQATSLRRAAVQRLDDAELVDAVILLAPNAIGISANAFQDEISQALADERATLTDDRVAGAIAIVERLRALDAANVLPGDEEESKSRSPLLWVSTGIIALIIVGGIVANRAAVRRRAQAELDEEEADRERAADDGAPPPELRQ